MGDVTKIAGDDQEIRLQTGNPDLLAVIQLLIADGAVIEVLTSDPDIWLESRLREPTLVYRPSPDADYHIWLTCPIIAEPEWGVAFDFYNDYWAKLRADGAWQEWLNTHPMPAEVMAA